MTTTGKLPGVFTVAVVPALMAIVLVAAGAAQAADVEQTTPGDYEITVPPNICEVHVEAYGASGGRGRTILR